ncbi:hypothetical protein Bbelb_082580 [Branchiostoma belcheri]|nr:hypothetical protein Bbelb_082580 [Branchiostoma belcheri]
MCRCRRTPTTTKKLVDLCSYVSRMDISVREHDQSYSESILREIQRKLTLEGGIINLPHPYMVNNGWSENLTAMQLTTPAIDTFFRKAKRDISLLTDGAEAKRECWSLHKSGHVSGVLTMKVSPSINYSFIKGRVRRETKTRESPWLGWMIVNERTWGVEAAYCHCPGAGGVRGTCKHIAALLYSVCSCVANGESVTSKPQQWGRPSSIHQPELIRNIRIKKAKACLHHPHETPSSSPPPFCFAPAPFCFAPAKKSASPPSFLYAPGAILLCPLLAGNFTHGWTDARLIAMEAQQTFLCDVCGKDFTSKSSYKRHHYRHSNTCVCLICSKTFHGKTALQHHTDFSHRDKTLQGMSWIQPMPSDPRRLGLLPKQPPPPTSELVSMHKSRTTIPHSWVTQEQMKSDRDDKPLVIRKRTLESLRQHHHQFVHEGRGQKRLAKEHHNAPNPS